MLCIAPASDVMPGDYFMTKIEDRLVYESLASTTQLPCACCPAEMGVICSCVRTCAGVLGSKRVHTTPEGSTAALV